MITLVAGLRESIHKEVLLLFKQVAKKGKKMKESDMQKL